MGIDISKNEFHVAVHGNNTVIKFDYTKRGFIKFTKEYNKILAESLIVLEATGGYEARLLQYLHSKGFAVHRANTRVVKSFVRSLSKLGKSDSIDAQGLARYAKERHEDLKLYIPPSDTGKELVELANRIIELKHMLVQEKHRMNAPDNSFCKSSNNILIESLEHEIERINLRQKQLITQNELTKSKVEVLQQKIAGIGESTAIQLVCIFPELYQIHKIS